MDEQEININRKDEDALLNLFNEHPNENVDKFIEELQKELNDLETVRDNYWTKSLNKSLILLFKNSQMSKVL
jgi:hypothetical protein